MNKKLVALFIVGLFVVCLAGMVSADYCSGTGDLQINSPAACTANGGTWIVTSISVPSSSTTDTTGTISEWFKANGFEFLGTRLAIWEIGGDISAISTKYFVLFLIILLIYSALTYANFPDSMSGSASFIRLLISVVVGVLSTVLITPAEIYSILQSYTALGVTLAIFFPIMILVFFNIVVATAGKPIGMFTSQILWLIYSLYLFFRAGTILILTNLSNATASGAGYIFSDKTSAGYRLAKVFIGETAIKSVGEGNFDPLVTWILFISAITIFVIFVWQGKGVNSWLAHERNISDIQAEKSTIERAKAREKLESQALGR